MAYQLEIQPGRQLLLEDSGGQTIITLLSSSAGQQQQSSQSLYTGAWTSPPTAYRTVGEIMIHLRTVEGDRTLYVQQNQIQLVEGAPTPSAAQPLSLREVPSSTMPSMKPMEPMTPMGSLSMGNMHMGLNPMEMQMGNMKLSMPSSSDAASEARRFCSQCGARVQVGDRFCAQCGHQLQA